MISKGGINRTIKQPPLTEAEGGGGGKERRKVQ